MYEGERKKRVSPSSNFDGGEVRLPPVVTACVIATAVLSVLGAVFSLLFLRPDVSWTRWFVQVNGVVVAAGMMFATYRMVHCFHRLRAVTAEASNSIRETAELLAAVGHDLMQPVKAMGVMLMVLERSGIARGDREIFSDMRETVSVMRGQLGGLLVYSRAVNGVVPVMRKAVALEGLLGRLGREASLQGQERGVQVRMVNTSEIVESDPLLLERIVRNLLDNAMNYSSRGRVLIGCRRRGGTLCLEVHDCGEGMAPEDAERIFQAFTRLQPPEQRSESLGLGLAICDRLARLLRHPLGVRARPGLGTVFWVELPRLNPKGEQRRTGVEPPRSLPKDAPPRSAAAVKTSPIRLAFSRAEKDSGFSRLSQG